DAAAIMNRNPRRPRRGIHERVKQRPVGNRIALVDHSFGLTVRRRNRAGVEMIAADDDRCLDLAPPNEFVYGDAEFRALAVTKPADARGQSLKLNTFARQLHPTRERFVLGKNFEREFVRACDVVRFAAQRDPAKRTFSFAKEWPDVFG